MVTIAAFDPAAFGQRLAQAIDHAGVTQAQLAEALGRPRSRVTDWIKGRRSPAARDLAAMSTVLGVSLDWLVTGRRPSSDERAVVDELAGLAESLVPLVTRAQQLAGS